MRPSHIFHLGIKELRSLARDRSMCVLIVFSFTVAVYAGTNAVPETLSRAPIAVVDEDQSPLAARIMGALRPPYFVAPVLVTQAEMDRRMDAGLDTFALDIPPDFQRDVLAGKSPVLQLNVDATRMSQGFTGSGYVREIVEAEVLEFARRYRAYPVLPVELTVRARFNPDLDKSWFGAVAELIDHVTMLAIILAGAALIRERERGTIEHLLVMPVSPLEIMAGKAWAMGLVVLVACHLSLLVVVMGLLGIPFRGSLLLFGLGTALHLFATTAMGIFLGTVARSMPQFGLLMIMLLLPLQMLSGAVTPRESMPVWIQQVMLVAPNTHYVMLAQGVLFRGAGIDIVYPQLVALALIGMTFFTFSLRRLRATIGAMA